MNAVNLIGRITATPELKASKTGKAYVQCTIAVQCSRDETLFVDGTAFDKTAETMAKYLHKGSLIGVSGRLVGKKWTDKDGNRREKISVGIDRFTFAESEKKKSEPTVEDEDEDEEN